MDKSQRELFHVIQKQNLTTCKYSVLQKYAKKLGFKANAKSESLIASLEEWKRSMSEDIKSTDKLPELEICSAKTPQFNDSHVSARRRTAFSQTLASSAGCDMDELSPEIVLGDAFKKRLSQKRLSEKKLDLIKDQPPGEEQSIKTALENDSQCQITPRHVEFSLLLDTMDSSQSLAVQKAQLKKALHQEAVRTVRKNNEIEPDVNPNPGKVKTKTPSSVRFKSVHKKMFSKMDSLQQYIDRKRARSNSLSAKKEKKCSLSHQPPKDKSKSDLTSLQHVNNMVKNTYRHSSTLGPASDVKVIKRAMKSSSSHQQLVKVDASKPAMTSQLPQKYSIPCAKANAATRWPSRNSADYSFHTPVVSRPPINSNTVTKEHPSSVLRVIKNCAERKSIAVLTPKFDLETSLSRKPSWKLHAGPLKPIENNHQALYKRTATPGSEKRKKMLELRNQRRFEILKKKRGQ